MKWSHIAAAAVAGAGLVMLSVSVVKFGPGLRRQASPAERPSRMASTDPSILNAKYPLSSQEGAEVVGETIAESIRDGGGIDPSVLRSLRDMARRAFPAYLSEHLSDFNAFLATMGVAPIGEGGDASDTKQWMAYRRCIADARFDPASVMVVKRTRAGVAVPVPEQRSVEAIERPKARPEWARNPLESYEVRVKGLFHEYAAGSAAFEATLGLEFARDPLTGEWMLIRSYIYNVPNGVTAIGPPV